MNWLTNFVKPKLSSLVKRREVPEKLWSNCVACGNMLHHKDLNFVYSPSIDPLFKENFFSFLNHKEKKNILKKLN